MLTRVALLLALLVAGWGIWLGTRPATTFVVVTDDAPVSPPAPAPATTSTADLRGRIVFEGAVPSGLRVEIVPDGKERSPETPGVEVSLTAEHVFAVPSLPGNFATVRATWEGGEARFGAWHLHPDEGEPRPPIDDWRLGSASLSGRVLDPSGRPIAGASVMDVIGNEDRPLVVADRCTWTDADGAWRFDFLPAGQHKITVYHPRSKAVPYHWRTAFTDLKIGDHQTVELGWAAGDVIWDGRLRSARGTVPRRVTLRLTDPKTSRQVNLACDSEGRFRAALRPGTYDLEVASTWAFPHEFLVPAEMRCSKPSAAPKTCIRLDSDSQAAITLIGGDISGKVSVPSRVVGSKSRIELEAWTADGTWLLRTLTFDLDESGRFSAVALRPGRYRIARFVEHYSDPVEKKGPELVGPDGQPVVVNVVNGGEIAGLELNATVPKD